MKEKDLENIFREKYRKPSIRGLPKYAQLRESLRAAIEDGHWGPGSKLPPETDLANSVGLSLGTVQKALQDLAYEGIVIRKQGYGTFVVEKSRRIEPLWHLRFFADGADTYLPIYQKVLFRERVLRPTAMNQFSSKDGKYLIQIDRVIDIGHEFLVYSKFFLSWNKFRAFMKKPIEELERSNFRSILNEEFNVTIAKVSYFLRVESLPPVICGAIGVAEGTLGLRYEITASSGSMKPVYYQEIFIPPNKRKLHIFDPSSVYVKKLTG